MTYDPYAQPEDAQEPTAAPREPGQAGADWSPISSPDAVVAPAEPAPAPAPVNPGPAFELPGQPAAPAPQPLAPTPGPQPAYPAPPQPQPIAEPTPQAYTPQAYPQAQPYPQAPQPYPQVPYTQPGYAPYPQPGMAMQPYAAYPVGQAMPYSPYGVVVYDDPNSPGAPVRGCGPLEAYKRFWTKGATFKGRASLSEYWWVALFNGLISGGLFIAMAASAGSSSDPNPILVMLFVGFLLAALVPSWALNARRLHDQNQSGWMQLMFMIPYVGPFVMLILMLQPGRPEGARYDR